MPRTQDTRDSRWQLWTRLAKQWDLPLPITADRVRAVRASLKRGKYWSSRQVFSVARQQRVALVKQALTSDAELLIKQTLRSIVRGLGPPTLKDAFTIEGLSSVTSAPTPSQQLVRWTHDFDCVLATIVCCWWMLRSTEVAAVRREHVWFKRMSFGKMASFALPVTRPTPSGCVLPAHTHACAQTTSHTYVHTAAWSSSSFAPTWCRQILLVSDETIQVFRRAMGATGGELIPARRHIRCSSSTSMFAASPVRSSSHALCTPSRPSSSLSELVHLCFRAKVCCQFLTCVHAGFWLTVMLARNQKFHPTLLSLSLGSSPRTLFQDSCLAQNCATASSCQSSFCP